MEEVAVHLAELRDADLDGIGGPDAALPRRRHDGVKAPVLGLRVRYQEGRGRAERAAADRMIPHV